ncbi:Cof-type HAD-IIB family hydrolase [Liquorilactobacillus hordei]|uniref:Cof-type HAD-IIB family hydrolase n=1 Tax=Liquorilactobacillus hordei TaxID=468911 RepID=UPI001CBB8F92|nr:Cof-type HAD-IIB family hydrolase [Liquorilactobacillus hordei]MBZ2404990.1 haloacid dehalogenase [Liquorilactobacillus hordei]
MIKHIFLDMDNTLLNSQGRISYQTTKFLREIKIPITLVSARAPMEMDFAIRNLALRNTQVSFNGGLIFEKKQSEKAKIFSLPLECTDTYKLLKLVTVDYPQVSVSWYTRNTWYARRIDKGTLYESELTGFHPELIDNISVEVLKSEPVYKIMIISFANETLKNIAEKINELSLNICAKFSGHNYLEITSSNATKNNAIAYIQSSEDLKKSELAAFGDGQNDIEMFKSVGTPIAMKNASSEVKEYAKFITLSNDEDGIIHGIKNYIL